MISTLVRTLRCIKFSRFFALAILVLNIPAIAANDNVPVPVNKRLKAAKIPHDAVSILVQEVGTGTPIASLNAERPRNPASTIKLLTTYAALNILGPNHYWETEFYINKPIRDGVLDGDLYLKAYGDPYMVTEEYWKIIGKLRRTGLKNITGDLIIDGSHFKIPTENPGAFDQEPLRLYNVIPHTMMVNFKAITFEFKPNRDGKRVDIVTDPALDNLNISNKLIQKKGPCRGYNRGIHMGPSSAALSDQVIFSGTFPSQCRSFQLQRTALEPSAYAFALFKKYWQQWGGVINGSVREQVVPNDAKLLLNLTTRPLAEIIRPLNKWSNNVMSRLLIYSIGASKYPSEITKEQGIEVVREWLTAENMDISTLHIDNGSGLSRTTRISAKTMTQLLQHAYQNPLMPEFLASMSLNGVDGTTRRRFRGRAESGRMHLKTGRLDGVAAIAGYVLAASGKMYSVVLQVNYPNVHRGAGIELQNALLKWVYQK